MKRIVLFLLIIKVFLFTSQLKPIDYRVYFKTLYSGILVVCLINGILKVKSDLKNGNLESFFTELVPALIFTYINRDVINGVVIRVHN